MPRVEPVATGYSDEVDHYVVCECGWVSLPACEWPRRVSCELCEVRAEGERNRIEYRKARQREVTLCAAVVRMSAGESDQRD